MLTRKQIFRGNLELHLKLEQFLYGNLKAFQLKQIRQQFSEEQHASPQKFHQLVVSVRDDQPIQNFPDRVIPQNQSHDQLDTSIIEPVTPISESQKSAKPLRNYSNLLEMQPKQAEVLIHDPALNLTTSIIISNQHDAIIIPDQCASLAKSACENLKHSEAEKQTKEDTIHKLMTFEQGENLENIQKDLKLLNNEVLFERKYMTVQAGRQGVQGGQKSASVRHKHAATGDIKQLREKIAADQLIMNEMIAEQQRNLADLMELEKVLQ